MAVVLAADDGDRTFMHTKLPGYKLNQMLVCLAVHRRRGDTNFQAISLLADYFVSACTGLQ